MKILPNNYVEITTLSLQGQHIPIIINLQNIIEIRKVTYGTESICYIYYITELISPFRNSVSSAITNIYTEDAIALNTYIHYTSWHIAETNNTHMTTYLTNHNKSKYSNENTTQ